MSDNKIGNISNLASILRGFEGFDKGRYHFITENPPTPQWSGALRFLRIFQWLVGEEGYRPESFSVDNVDVDFYYYSDKSVDSIVVKGVGRDEDLFQPGTYLGDIARKIAKDNRVAFCHAYKIYDDYYGCGLDKEENYNYITKANLGNLREKIKAIGVADKALDDFLIHIKKGN